MKVVMLILLRLAAAASVRHLETMCVSSPTLFL